MSCKKNFQDQVFARAKSKRYASEWSHFCAFLMTFFNFFSKKPRMLGKQERKSGEFLPRKICIMAGVKPQSDDLLLWNLPVLLKFNKSWFSRIARRSIHAVFWRMRRIGCVHPRLWSARGALVRAPQIREIQRVGAYWGHFFETNLYAAFYTLNVNRMFHFFIFFPPTTW